ncbi:MAG: hypothetical protein H0W00_00065 [Chloroflexi bacterium]|nr:hypothetical protein [Chloroflexota bacterium]
MSTLVRPALMIHVFAPIGGTNEDRDAAQRYLSEFWEACAQVGAHASLMDGLPTDLPPLPERDDPGFRLLAGRSRVDADGVRQAYAYARHDVVGVSVALATSRQDEPWESWAALLTSWEEAAGTAGAPPSILGEARVFLGHVEAPAKGLASLGATVESTLRSAGLGAWQPAEVTPEGAAIWSWRDQAGRRVAAVLTVPEREQDVSRWLWWRDTREATPFGLYLLNAAKLDYQVRVYRARREPLFAALRTMDAELDVVLALHAQAGLSGRTSLPGLMAAQQRLIEAQAASASMAIELTHLRALKRTVVIARRNLAHLSPVAVSSPDTALATGRAGSETSGSQADSMGRRDQDLAAWLEEQVENDIGYAEAAMARSREAQQLTMLRLQQAGTQIARAQSRVTLLQTSLLGALLASLGAVAVLRITFEPPIPMRVPMLLSLGALLLAAPALATHWFERYSAVDHWAAAILGAALGWLAVSALGAGDSLPIMLVGVAAGIAMARALTWLHDRAIAPRTQGTG